MNPLLHSAPAPWRRPTEMRRALVIALAAGLLPFAAAAAAPATAARAFEAAPCTRADADWIVTSLLGKSMLSGNRPDWLEGGVEVLHRLQPGLYAGGRVESRTRNDVSDVLYTALMSHTPAPSLEWHASATFVSDPHFSVEQGYGIGAEWRFARRFSALLDYARLEFPAGGIDQFKPGLTAWFSDCNFLTGRYWSGRAFGDADYDGYLLRLDLGDIGLPARGRLAVTYAHGADPEKEVGLPTILTSADGYGLFGYWPVGHGVELIVGGEYEDRRNVYTRTTATVGLSLRF